MSEGYNGPLPPYYLESSDPITPNLGLSLIGMDPILAYDMVLIDTALSVAGTKIEINGSVVSTLANFNSVIPAAPAGFANVIWQVSGSSVSAYYAVGIGTPGGSPTQLQFDNGGVFGGVSGSAVDPSGSITLSPTGGTVPALLIDDDGGGTNDFIDLYDPTGLYNVVSIAQPNTVSKAAVAIVGDVHNNHILDLIVSGTSMPESWFDEAGMLTTNSGIALTSTAIFYDSLDSAGTSGQILSSEGALGGVKWIDASSGSGYTVVSKTSNYNAQPFDDVWCTGTFTVTLPAASTTVRVKVRNVGTGVITVSPPSGTINGQASYQLARQYTAAEFATTSAGAWGIE